MSRKPLSRRTRFEVFKRDGFVCQYCGGHPPQVILECDHVTPVSAGGGDEIDNLVTACFDCNRGKSDVPLTSIAPTLAERAALAAEREDQIAGYEAIMRAVRERVEADAEEAFSLLCEAYGVDSLPGNYFQSIRMFVGKLVLSEVLDAIDVAKRRYPRDHRQAFKYFCGVCWQKVKRGGHS